MQFTGIDDFDTQFRVFLNTLANEIKGASEVVIDDARNKLREHIAKDVYKAYEPTAYKRRIRNPSYGTPISDMNAYTKEIAPSGGNVNGELIVTSRLWYNPEGKHKVAKWSSHPSKTIPSWINNLDYNEMIARIEKKNPAYNWGQDKFPPRPFWQKFIDEMVDGGEIEQVFVRELAKTEEVISDGGVVEEASDRNYI